MANNLKIGDRVRTRGQRYIEAMYWGTGTVIESFVDGQQYYRVSHDPNTRLFTIDASVYTWHHTHLCKADFQFDVTDYDFVPYVDPFRARILESVGFERGVHFELWVDDFPETNQ